jgi:hypothetical protein
MKNLLTLIFTFITCKAIAQNLPNVQQRSLWAPSNIKIDGKPTEWDKKFEAHNNATNIDYTLCNDGHNLYMVIQTSDADVLSKITNRGILLVIYLSGKKNSSDATSITYPIFDLQYGNKPYINFSNAGGLTHAQHLAMDANPDSMLRVANKKLHNSEKYIRTSGMADVDSLISVYNDQDIIAREGFDKGMVYTYELALPLKYLKLSTTNPFKFSYHIVLAGLNIDKDFGMQITKMPDGQEVITFARGAAMVNRDHLPAVTSTTDFWGEYTLAKRP